MAVKTIKISDETDRLLTKHAKDTDSMKSKSADRIIREALAPKKGGKR